jgi:LacI family transcriptional regulator
VKNKKVTIHDIAAHLNMSASTVSRALANNSRISQKTRDLVKSVALEMNYKPNQLASNLRRGKGKMVGVIVPRISRHFFSHVISGIETITNPAGYNLIICQSNESYETEVKSLQTMLNNRVDGVVMSISGETRNIAHIKAAIEEKMPIVFFDRTPGGIDVDSVQNDNFTAGYEMTKHLISQGYRKIAHFAGPLDINIYRDRYNGYRKALDEEKIPYNENLLFEDVITRPKGEKAAMDILESGDLPDAVFSVSDYAALGALMVFKKNGIKIPDQMGITGFANEPFTELVEPPMTTVEQFGEEIGRNAARLLIDRLEGGQHPEASRLVSFKPRIIFRGSSLPMKNDQ